MQISSQIHSNVFYYNFLRVLLYLVETLPPFYGKILLQGAKLLVGAFPLISMLLVSISSIFVQNYFTRVPTEAKSEPSLNSSTLTYYC